MTTVEILNTAIKQIRNAKYTIIEEPNNDTFKHIESVYTLNTALSHLDIAVDTLHIIIEKEMSNR